MAAEVSEVTKLVEVGDVAPDFELPAAQGGAVKLAAFRGNKPVVVAFLKGMT